jgi:hypothetical protein
LSGWLFSWGGGVIAALADLSSIVVNKLQAHFYGICIGLGTADGTPALTDWLSQTLNEIAGLSGNDPLTFGKLEEQDIYLKMVTSNLSHGQPYLMPDNLDIFLFKAEEFKQFFPSPIVEYMTHHQPKQTRVGDRAIQPPLGYSFFPEKASFPVVVAARLSISFPIILCAVPVYTVPNEVLDKRGDEELVVLLESELQPNWLSDGGICNNFPIQFFDKWLPTHPTFGINLTSLRRTSPKTTSVLEKTSRLRKQAPIRQGLVFLPRADDPIEPEWEDLTNLRSFLQAILATGLYHPLLTQAQLPSYRERIVQIRLAPDEDGLHLNMAEKTLQQLMGKGGIAGKFLTDPDTFSFEQHRWVRLQVLMSLLEQHLEEISTLLPDYDKLLQQPHGETSGFPFPRDTDWEDEAKQRLENLHTLAAVWKQGGALAVSSQQAGAASSHASLFRDGAPQSGTGLRVVPDLE